MCSGFATIRSRPASPRRSSSRAKACAVFIDEHTFGDLQSFREIPTQVLYRCEWGHDDDSLEVKNLPKTPQQQPKIDKRGQMAAKSMSTEITPFERIRRESPAGNEYWSSRDFAQVLGYADYRNFDAVGEKARTACFNSGQRVDDHFVEITKMVGIGSGAQRPVKTVMMSRYACCSEPK